MMAPQSRDPRPKVLLTRPTEQAERFAAQLRARFGDSLVLLQAPLLQPRFLPPRLPPGPFAALILTSETGAAALKRISADHPDLPRLAFCVGDRTAEAARQAGFTARSAAGDANALLAAVQAEGVAGPLLHLRGREARGELAARLTQAGIPTEQAILYAQEGQPLPPAVLAILSRPDPVIVPLFSPRTAALFAAEVLRAPLRAPLWVAALSPAVATEVHPLRAARLQIAAHPDAPAMLDAIARLLPPPPPA